MDTSNGRIYTAEQVKTLQEMLASGQGNLMMMQLPPTPKQMDRHPPRVGRNEPCPCGSGKKFKRCCLNTPSGGEVYHE